MTIPGDKARLDVNKILNNNTIEKLTQILSPKKPENKPLPDQVPLQRSWSNTAYLKRQSFIREYLNKSVDFLTGTSIFDNPEIFKGNIENFIGLTQIPTGLIGPLRINGTEANGDFYLPLATTEGALVASYSRGAEVVSLAGGVRVICLTDGVQRTPSFKFANLIDAGKFLIWVMDNIDSIKQVVSQKTSHGILIDVNPNLDGNLLTLVFEYHTGDAAGQNMVTICTQAACEYIINNCPIKPDYWLIEGNLSGDKKASAISFISVRGKKVTAEALIPEKIIKEKLNVDVKSIVNAGNIAIFNGIQSGSIGVNFHFANCLTALFLACGQDVATIAEASIGTTRFDISNSGDFYVCVTLPNLIVGTVGGGTILPTQSECLKLIDCYGEGKSRKFAEICAALTLCGEISLAASIASGSFARAHQLFGRKKQ